MEVVPDADERDERAGLRWWKEVAAGSRRVPRVLGRAEPVRLRRRRPGPGLRSRGRHHRPQTTLHLYFEPDLQQWYLDLPANGLIRLWNVYYGIAHFLVTLVALVWMFRRDPRRHRLLRNTLVFTTCLAVIGFAVYSLMPPRLLDDPGRYGGCQVYAPEAAAAAEPGALTAPGCDRTGSSTRSPPMAAGSASATRATRTCRTSTRPCPACTSAGRPGARSCCSHWCVGDRRDGSSSRIR